MTLRQYFPLSIGIFALIVAGAYYVGVPVAPVAIVVLAGETILGFELEDQKALRFLRTLFGNSKAWHVH